MRLLVRLVQVTLLLSSLILGPRCRADWPGPPQNSPVKDEASVGPQAKGLAGLSLEQQGDLQIARREYATALATYQRIEPSNAVVDNKIGIAYSHLFALDQALKQYQLALKLNPRYAEAYNNEGAAYQGKLNYSSAIKAYKRALKLNSRLAPSYRNLGLAYIEEGKYSKASPAFRKALQLDPHSFDPNRPGDIETLGTLQQRIEIAIHLADVLAIMRQNEQAIDELKKACSLGFNDRKRLFRDSDLKLLRDTPEFHLFLVEEHLNEIG